MPDAPPLIPGPFLRSEARVLGVPERRLNSRYFRTVFGGVVVDARIILKRLDNRAPVQMG